MVISAPVSIVQSFEEKMEIISIREILVVGITILFVFLAGMNKRFDTQCKCFESKNKKFVKFIIATGAGFFIGIMLASIINHYIDGKIRIPYHDNTMNIILDAFKYLFFISPIVFSLFYFIPNKHCNIKLKREIAFKMTFSLLLGLVLLLPILMARINIKYDISNPKNEIVTIFNKHKSTVRCPACHLSIGSSIQEQSSISLDIGFCDKVEKWQKLKLEYREGYLGYKWISKIQYASKNTNKSLQALNEPPNIKGIIWHRIGTL